MPRKIEISHKTIIFTVFFLISLSFLYRIRDILFQLFVALFIMVILNPTVKRLQKYKVPRAVSVLIVYLTAIGLVTISIASIAPALVEQTNTFTSNLPNYLNDLGISPFIVNQLNSEILSQIGSIPSQVIKLGVSVFSNLVNIVTVLIFAFYLLMARNKLDVQLEYFVGVERNKKLSRFLDQLEIQLGGWARGQLFLMFMVGFSTYVGLVLLGIPYAVALAIIAGLLEAVPYVGPIIAAIPSVIIGFGISPVLGLATVALAFLIQQVEAYVFVPKVMERSVGLNPVVTLLALAIGFRVAGIGGVLMSVPAAIALRIFFKEFIHKD